MEKTTKKRKKSKRLKRRIGLIAVGGLSFVLTICLSVGATLAWFAGSTWASNDLYMGGPVYVEMAGRGQNGYTTGTDGGVGNKYATWEGGSGTLDIAASARTTGTAAGQNDGSILLPGQKLLIYSQARVYSTLQTSTVQDGSYDSMSSGADNSNTSNGQYKYYDGQGRVQTTTTSVLRAKFSINIEFDPSVGFNNFTDQVYAQGYPVQSTTYKGEYGTANSAVIGTPNSDTASFDKTDDGSAQKGSLNWVDALGATHYTITRQTTSTPSSEPGEPPTVTTTVTEAGRRDAVGNTALVEKTANPDKYDYDKTLYANLNTSVTPWVNGEGTNDMWQVKYGLSKSIYKWKYVSKSVYEGTDSSMRVGAPFNGMFNTAGGASAADTGAGNGTGNGFYAIYESDGAGGKAESDAFYKARTAAYLDSYAEHYVDDYNRDLVLKIGSSLSTLEDALNQSFINLIGQSSDNIWAGNLMGFNAESDGRITYPEGATAGSPAATGIPASWLYVDPVIGNDTNSADGASSVGGWWYLVENVAANGNKSSGNNTIVTQIDNVVKLKAGEDGVEESDYEETGATTADAKGIVTYNWGTKDEGITNNTNKIPAAAQNRPKEGVNFERAEDITTAEQATKTGVAANDKQILTAKLYEITPNLQDKLIATSQDGTNTKTTKVVSVAFPFVNGNFELPGQALTNIFANAKISFQITFQALQAFFPFSSSIDSIPSGTAITGTGKALNIGNAIPIYNEAFDYLSWLDTSSR